MCIRDSPTKSLNNSKRFFTPIVASSLALFLGATLAKANTISCDNSTQPSLCYNGADTGLSDIKFETSGNTFTPQHTNGATTTIENLEFQFHGGASNNPTGSWDSSKNTYIIKSVTGGDEIFTLNGNGKGMKMGESGDKTLTIYFAESDSDNRRVFTLNLGGVDSNTYAFEGKLVVQPGKGWANGDEAHNGKFVGVFGGKGVKGDIAMNKKQATVGNASGFRATLDFENGANLEGNLSAEAGITTATFQSGKITGNVTAKGQSTGATPTLNVVFERQGEIGGHVSTTRSGWAAQSNITFKQGGTIQKGVMASGTTNTVTAVAGTLTIGSPNRATSSIVANGGHTATNTISAQDLNIYSNVITSNNKNSSNGNSITATNNLVLRADEIKVDFSGSGTNANKKGNTFTVTESANITATTIKATYGHNNIETKSLTLTAGTIETNGTSSLSLIHI